MTTESDATLRPMRLARLLALVAPLAAGIAIAIALTVPPGAAAWDIGNLPPGFVTLLSHASGVTTCPDFWEVAYVPNPGANSGHLCLDSPTFQRDLDVFVDANYTAPVTTTAQPPATTTTADPGVTTTPSTVPVGTTTGATTTTATPTQSVVTVTVSDPTVNERLSALEQRQSVDEARLSTIEAQLGIIVPEAKNQPPFTNPA